MNNYDKLNTSTQTDDTNPTNVFVFAPGAFNCVFANANDTPRTAPSLIALRRTPNEQGELSKTTMELPANYLTYCNDSTSNEAMQRIIEFVASQAPASVDFKLQENIFASADQTHHHELYNTMKSIARDTPNYVMGYDVYAIKDISQYDILPMFIDQGTVNYQRIPSLSLCMTLLEHFIRWAVSISPVEPSESTFCFIVPDEHDRLSSELIVKVAFEKLGFKYVFPIPHSTAVSASSTSHGHSCVLDFGYSSTRIVCTEEGSILPQSRITLPFGAAQMTNFFMKCLDHEKAGIPETISLLAAANDLEKTRLIEETKQSLLTLIPRKSKQALLVPVTSDHHTAVSLQLGPAAHWASRCIFEPLSILPVERRSQPFCLAKPTPLYYNHDVRPYLVAYEGWEEFDDERGAKALERKSQRLKKVKKDDTEKPVETPVSDIPLPRVDWLMIADSINFSIENALKVSSIVTSKLARDTDAKIKEMREEFYLNIIVTGGLSNIDGLHETLESYIRPEGVEVRLSSSFSTTLNCKYGNGMDASWRGGALCSINETASEFTISNQEYQREGNRIIREKVVFPW